MEYISAVYAKIIFFFFLFRTTYYNLILKFYNVIFYQVIKILGSRTADGTIQFFISLQ